MGKKIIKKRLIILSDLWGFQKSKWIKYYTELLDPHFNIVIYNSSDLAGITSDNIDDIHQQFVAFGIKKAVKKIIELEKRPITILAFSIGGTIAWRTALKNASIKNLILVSATRLRLETKTPDCKTSLFYGKLDKFKPANHWLKNHTNVTLIENAGHELYTDINKATLICTEILRNHLL